MSPAKTWTWCSIACVKRLPVMILLTKEWLFRSSSILGWRVQRAAKGWSCALCYSRRTQPCSKPSAPHTPHWLRPQEILPRSIAVQRKVKRGSLTGAALCPNPAAVPGNDSLNRGQPDPSAGKLVLPVESLEGSEEFFRGFHFKPCAIVSDEENLFASVPRLADLDASVRPFGSEFPRVANEIHEHVAQEDGVASRAQAALNHNLNGSLWLAFASLPHYLFGERAEIYSRPAEFGFGDARQRQEAFDKVAHTPATRGYPIQVLVAVFAKNLAVFAFENLARAKDRAQWRSQIVRYRIREGFEVLVGEARVRSALGHTA